MAEAQGIWMDIDELKPHPKNPKDHEDEDIKLIAESIKSHGFGRPIELSSDGYILAGHGTYYACKDFLTLKELNKLQGVENKKKMVKVDYLNPPRTHDDPAAISYMIADNKIAELSGWNYGKLTPLLEEIKLTGFDVTLTGFEEPEIENIEMRNEDYSKDEFEGLVDKFQDGTPKSDKNARWFYIEYYTDEDKWDELISILKHKISGEHEIDAEWFYDLIKKSGEDN